MLHTTALISQSGIDLVKSQGGLIGIPGGGCSAIFGPDGRKLTDDIPDTEEGVLYHDLDLSHILQSRVFIDVCGRYSRPDMLWLGVDNEVKRHVKQIALSSVSRVDHCPPISLREYYTAQFTNLDPHAYDFSN